MKAGPGRLYFRCFLRSYLVGAAYNPQGLQNTGFFYALDPALRALYKDGAALREARLRHARYYNCHPFFTPMFLGVMLRMERTIAAGQLDPAILMSLKDTTANTLSAIGDSFFNGSLLGAWALGSACLVLAGHPLWAAALAVFLLVSLQAWKLITFIMGVRKGMAVLALLKRLDLATWSVRVKYANAALLSGFLWLALPDAPPGGWALTTAGLLGASWMVGRLHVSRVFVALVFFALLGVLHWSAGTCGLGFF